MTSEGQHAGQQPAGATSGGGTEPFGADGFPPDSDGQRIPSRSSAPQPPTPQPPAAQNPAPHGAAPYGPVSHGPVSHGLAPQDSASPGPVSAEGFPFQGSGSAQAPADGPSFPGPAQGAPFPGAAAQPPASYPPAFPPPPAEPNSYAPPPHATPNGGSPFVVPAVPPAGQAFEAASNRAGGRPFAPEGRSGGASPAEPPAGRAAPGDPSARPFPDAPPDGLAHGATSGSARVPGPQDSGPLPQRGSASPFDASAPDTNGALPQRGHASPFGASAPDTNGALPQRGPASPFGGGTPSGPVGSSPLPQRGQAGSAESAWAPRSASPRPFDGAPDDAAHPYRSGGPLDGPPPGDVHGFAPGSPTRGSAGADPDESPDDQAAGGRAPGVSAFGGQRSRVPGATLTGLPGAAPADRDDDGPPFRTPPTREPREDNGALPYSGRREDSGALPPRRPLGDSSPQQQAGGLPARGSSAFGQRPFGGDPSSELPSLRPGDSDAFGRSAQPFGQPPSGAGQPFGQPPSGAGQPFGDARSGGLGQPSAGPFGARPGVAPAGARPAEPPASMFGARPGEAPAGARPAEAPAEPSAGSHAFGSRPEDRDIQDAPSSGGARPFGAPGSGDQPFGTPGGRSATGRPFGGSPFEPRSVASESADEPADEPAQDSGLSIFDRPRSGRSAFERPSESSGSEDYGRSLFGSPGEAAPGEPRDGTPGGFVQRVPGASFAPGEPPDSQPGHEQSGPPSRPTGAASGHQQSGSTEHRNSAVPAPRDPAERPATGTARPVSASASVPMAGRVDPAELPPPSAAPQARVYGRAAAPQPEAEPEQRDDEVPGAWPWDARRQRDERRSDQSAGSAADGDAPLSPYQRGYEADAPQQPAPAPQPAPAQQSPARASGRATASARVTPPGQPPASGPDAPRSGPPYTEFTTDVAGRGRPEAPQGGQSPESGTYGGPASPDYYGEHTTDISGRGRGQDGQQPYVPAPALPSMHASPSRVDGFPSPDQPPPPPGMEGDRPRMGGVFPGPASRATVAPPPGPDETASWPGSGDQQDDDQGRFDQFKPEAPVTKADAKPESTHVRMLPVLLGVVIAAALLVGAAFGIVYLISGGSDSGIRVSAGDCVKRDGDEAVTASCSDAGAFEVVSVADTKEQCADPNQPYVLNPTSDGRTQVLCLKPRS